MSRVKLDKVEKIYPSVGKSPEFKAVHGINLEINDKEFMVLVGPSGCAKSTTLRMIAGLEEITNGEIYIGENLVNKIPPKDRNIAMVFQSYALYPHMSVYQNMSFGLRLKGIAKKEIKNKVDFAAKILGIEGLLDRKPKALSGGQRQRVAVGRAIVRDPEVFLFDEPLSNLDAKMRVSMRAEISKLHKHLEATMIYVTHDQTEAMTMGDRITVMSEGRIMQCDEPLELYHNPRNKFVAGFIGNPQMNFIEGIINKNNVSNKSNKNLLEYEFQEIGNKDFRFQISNSSRDKEFINRISARVDKNITLGVRPEDITFAGKNNFANKAEITALIEIQEFMGAESLLHLKTNEHNLVAKVPPSGKHNSYTKAKFDINLDKVHFFDSKTELAL